MRIFLASSLKDSPWGGGNQFQLALSNELRNRGLLSMNLRDADVMLANSHHFRGSFIELHDWKRRGGTVIHRVDGPLVATRGGRGARADFEVALFNRLVADGTIFQSEWSRSRSKLLVPPGQGPSTVIINAPNPAFSPNSHLKTRDRKLRIVSTSWSTNSRKGFELLAFLDNNLDFDRFSVAFIGRTPLRFKNIAVSSPMVSTDLAAELAKNDVFITGSKNDPCSNALIEGIAAGLVPVALRSGGHPEILSGKGLLFDDWFGALNQLESLYAMGDKLRETLVPEVPSISSVTDSYLGFFRHVVERRKLRTHRSKRE